MTMLAPFFARIEETRIATAIGQSVLVTGLLSGVHLLGLTVLVGSVLVSTLRLTGLALMDVPIDGVLAAPRRGIVIGLIISVVSGLLLLSPRVSHASASGVFQLKMLLLSAAVAFHFGVYQEALQSDNRWPLRPGVVGALGLALWSSVVLAGCAFILIE